jgi:hypothetical protein
MTARRKRLRELRRHGAKYETAAGREAVEREIAQLEAQLLELGPWTVRRKQFANYMARLAGVTHPSPEEAADVDEAVENTVALLREEGYDLKAKAAKFLPRRTGGEAAGATSRSLKPKKQMSWAEPPVVAP